MEEILYYLVSMKPYEKWDILHMNWCRISSINRIIPESSNLYFHKNPRFWRV